jgi:hypothetical protein
LPDRQGYGSIDRRSIDAFHLDEVTVYNRTHTSGNCGDLQRRAQREVHQFASQPERGGNTGNVSVNITGTGFQQGAAGQSRNGGAAQHQAFLALIASACW